MKKQYLFRHENVPMHVNSVVYHVWVGTSEREQKFLAQVKHESQFAGYTIQQWDESVDMWLLVESERVFSGAGLINFGFVRADLTISELRELCFSKCWKSFESAIPLSQSFLRMFREARPDLYSRKNLSGTVRSRALLTRKNLSSVNQ